MIKSEIDVIKLLEELAKSELEIKQLKAREKALLEVVDYLMRRIR